MNIPKYMTKDFKGFLLEPDDYWELVNINKRLFGDGTMLTADTRRDLANRMHVILLRAVPLKGDLK